MTYFDAAWVGIAAIFVLFVVVSVVRQARRPPPEPAPSDHTVWITGGRDGSVVYRDAAGQQEFGWETAGSTTPKLAWIFVPTEREWPAAVPWAAERRAEIVERVAREAVRQKFFRARWELTERTIDFYPHDA